MNSKLLCSNTMMHLKANLQLKCYLAVSVGFDLDDLSTANEIVQSIMDENLKHLMFGNKDLKP